MEKVNDEFLFEFPNLERNNYKLLKSISLNSQYI